VNPQFLGTGLVTHGSRLLKNFKPKPSSESEGEELSGKVLMLDLDLPGDLEKTLRVNRAALSNKNRYKAIKHDPNEANDIHLSKQFEKRTGADGTLVAVYCLDVKKKFPREEIKMLLFSHAILKRNLAKMQRSLFAHWAKLSTRAVYRYHQAAFLEFCQLRGTTLAKLQDDVVAVLAGGQDWKDFLSRAAMGRARPVTRLNNHVHDTSTGGKVYDRVMSAPNDEVWTYVKEKISRKVAQQGLGEAPDIENSPNETTERFHNSWDEEVAPGLQSMRDLSTWFSWDQDSDFRSSYETVSPSFVGRKEVLIDWLFDPATELLMVTSLHQAVEMLATEHRSIIDIRKSMVRMCSAVFSSSHEPRDGIFVFGGEQRSSKPTSISCLRELTDSAASEKDRDAWREVSTCFSGDHLQLELSLRNCFNQIILIPSKKTKWEVNLVARPAAAHRDTDEVRLPCVLLRAFSKEEFGMPTRTFCEIVLPGNMKQGKYHLEFKVFDHVLPWESEESIAALNVNEVECFGDKSVLEGGGTPTESMARALMEAGIQQGDQLQIDCRAEEEAKNNSAISVVKDFPRHFEVCSLSEKGAVLDRPYLPGHKSVGNEVVFNFEKVLTVSRVAGHGTGAVLGADLAASDDEPVHSHRAQNLLFVQQQLRARKDGEFGHNPMPPVIPADTNVLVYNFGTLVLNPNVLASGVEVHGAIIYAVLERSRLSMGETGGCSAITSCTGIEQWDPVGECQVRLARLARGQYVVEAMEVSPDLKRYTDVTIEEVDDLELGESDNEDEVGAAEDSFDKRRQDALAKKKKDEEDLVAGQTLEVFLNSFRNLQLWKSYDGSFVEIPLTARKAKAGFIEWYGVVDSATVWATWDYKEGHDAAAAAAAAAAAIAAAADKSTATSDGDDDDNEHAGTAARQHQGCLRSLKEKMKSVRNARMAKLDELEFRINAGSKTTSQRLDLAVRGEKSADGRIALHGLDARKSNAALRPFWSAPIQLLGTRTQHSIALQGRDALGRPGPKLTVTLDMDFSMGIKDDSFQLQIDAPEDAMGIRLQAQACLLGVASSDDKLGTKQPTNADGTRYRARCYFIGNGEDMVVVMPKAKSPKVVVLGADAVKARQAANASTDAATRKQEEADAKAAAAETARIKKEANDAKKAAAAKLKAEKAEKAKIAKAERDKIKAAEAEVKAQKKAAADKAKADAAKAKEAAKLKPDVSAKV
jgi:hypothetical protein